MTANLNPVFTVTPNVGVASISTGDASRTAPASAGTVVTAGANGTMVEFVFVRATGTTTAGMVRLFLFDGTSYHLLEEIAVSPITPSGTAAAFAGQSAVVTPATPLVIPSGWSLRATTQNSEAFQVIGLGGDF